MDICACASKSLEALYVTLEDCELGALPTWAFDGISKRFGHAITEFAIDCTRCDLHWQYPIEEGGDALYRGEATADDVTRHILRSLPDATLYVKATDEPSGTHEPDPLHRAFLPATKEPWHYAQGTRGRDRLRL